MSKKVENFELNDEISEEGVDFHSLQEEQEEICMERATLQRNGLSCEECRGRGGSEELRQGTRLRQVGG